MYLKHLLSLVLVRQICGGEECTFSDRTGHETTDWFKLGKEYVKAIYCHPAYLTYMQSTSCEMLGWMKHKLESRLLEKIWITSDMLMTPPYGQEPLDEGERGEWKSCLKTQHSKDKDHGIQPHHFMANRWENNANSERLLFWGAPKSLQMVTAAMKFKDTCSLE